LSKVKHFHTKLLVAGAVARLSRRASRSSMVCLSPPWQSGYCTGLLQPATAPGYCNRATARP